MDTATAPQLVLPPPLAADLGKHPRTEVATGESGASVLRFDRPTGSSVYLKSRAIEPSRRDRPLFDEAERLGWMHAVGLSVPAVLQYHEWKAREYLLLTAMPGTDASAPIPADRRGAAVAALAAALRTIHATNISACPFDATRRVRIPEAKTELDAGRVRESDFDAVRKGRTGADLYAELLSTLPAIEERVFTHGDFCLPNVLLQDDGAGGYRVSGFVDCGRAGIADPYQDLALCARSVAFNFGPEWAAVLFAKYGIERVDEVRVGWYQLLDEFF